LLPSLPVFLSKLPESESSVFYHAPVFAKKASDAAMRRGPPCCVQG